MRRKGGDRGSLHFRVDFDAGRRPVGEPTFLILAGSLGLPFGRTLLIVLLVLVAAVPASRLVAWLVEGEIAQSASSRVVAAHRAHSLRLPTTVTTTSFDATAPVRG